MDNYKNGQVMAEETANKQVPSILNGCFVDQCKFHDDMIFNVLKLNIKKRFEA